MTIGWMRMTSHRIASTLIGSVYWYMLSISMLFCIAYILPIQFQFRSSHTLFFYYVVFSTYFDNNNITSNILLCNPNQNWFIYFYFIIYYFFHLAHSYIANKFCSLQQTSWYEHEQKEFPFFARKYGHMRVYCNFPGKIWC